MPAMREFMAPWALAAVAVLGINDAWLKPTFHNILTGKLSDVAGCFFLPLYVSALLSMVVDWAPGVRLKTGVVVTALIFVPTSLSRAAADALCAALSIPGAWLGMGPYRIAADPWDLLALPMAGVAYMYGMRRTSSLRTPGRLHALAA